MEKNQNSWMSYSSLATLAFALALGQGGVGCARPKNTPTPTVAPKVQDILSKGQMSFLSVQQGNLNSATLSVENDLDSKNLTPRAVAFMEGMPHQSMADAVFTDARTISITNIDFSMPGDWTIRVQLLDAQGNVVATADYNIAID